MIGKLFSRPHSGGQSLVELLVAIAVGAILFVGTATLIAPSLKINKTISQAQTGAALGNELMDNVKVFSEGNWHNVLNLATGTANTYYLVTSSSPFTAASGTESIQVSTTTYTRDFYLTDVYRDANGNVTSTATGNSYDPSTKLITIQYNWTHGVTTTMMTYLTRNRNDFFDQADWSGGSGLAGPVTSTNNQFSASTGMVYDSPGTLFAQAASSSYSNGYTYRRTITIASSSLGSSTGTLSNFPMLVSGTYSYLAASSSGGMVQNPNGYDIIFTSDAAGNSPLSYEFESYASSTGAVNLWVNVPTLSSSTQIYMFYDNPTVTTNQSNPSGTWNSNYLGVYHFPSVNGLLDTGDSTGNNNYGISSGATATTTIIDGGANFVTASNEYVSIGNNINPSAETVSAWVNGSSFPDGYNAVFSHVPSGSDYLQLFVENSGKLAGYVYGNANVDYDASGVNTLSPNTWYFLTLSYSSSAGLVGYVDGSVDGTAGANGALNAAGTAATSIGTDLNTGGRSWNGDIDEVEISNVVLSQPWILTEYNNQNSPATFYGIGSATTNGGGGNTTGTISSAAGQYWAWNDSLGWLDFYNSGHVGVNSTGLTGYASSSAGDVSLDCATTRNGNICGGGGVFQDNQSLTVTSTTSIASGTLTSFPMLVSSTVSAWASSAHGGDIQNLVTAPNGSTEPADLVFATSTTNCTSGSYLNFETESYNSSTGALADWVNVPTMQAGTVIYVCYDASSVTTDQSHPSSTWNSNYVGVYHFPTLQSTSTLQLNDSTANANTGASSSQAIAAPGIVGGGLSAFAYYANATFPSQSYNQLGSGSGTVSVWVYATSTQAYDGIFDKGDECNSQAEYCIDATIGTNNQYYFAWGGGGSYSSGNANLALNTWHLFDLVSNASNNTVNVYIDGVLNSSVGSWSSYNTNSSVITLGDDPMNSDMVGNYDEFRINKTALTPSWILTEYNNQNSPSTFYTLGSQQSGQSSYQVLNDGSGNLSGWAWNDDVGWISFCGGKNTTSCPGATNYETTIDSGGNFQGWAWNDDIGWISFNCDNNSSCGTSNYEVKTTWLPPAATQGAAGQLSSPIFDTGESSGAQFNSIMWQGSQVASSTVSFQVAVSNSSSGPWTYIGPDGTTNTYYTPTGPGLPVSLNDSAFNNYRYFRYEIFIIPVNSTSSIVKNVVVNWSP